MENNVKVARVYEINNHLFDVMLGSSMNVIKSYDNREQAEDYAGVLNSIIAPLLTASRAEGRLEGVLIGLNEGVESCKEAIESGRDIQDIQERLYEVDPAKVLRDAIPTTMRSLPADKIAHDSMCRNESSVIAEDLSKTKEAI